MSDTIDTISLNLNQPRYLISLHRSFSYIEKNLSNELNLKTVAAVANFSTFHFHRIFKALTNETLSAYIRRKRLEKAAALLIREQQRSITDICYDCGYTNATSFTRAFKQFYGISPKEFRTQSPSRYAQIKSKKCKTSKVFETYVCNIETLKQWYAMNATIEMKEFEQRTFACIDHIGKEGLPETFNKLITWAGKKGLMENQPQIGLIYHDSYKITNPEHVRMSVCILIDNQLKLDEGLGLIQFPKGKHLVGRFEIGITEFEKSWSSMFIYMNEHGYQMRDLPPFELYQNNFNEHPEKKFILDLCIPIH